MAIVNRPFLITVEARLAGADVPGLGEADFDAVTMRGVSVGGGSPPALTLTAGVEFTVEDLGDGAYGLTFSADTVPATGDYLITVTNTLSAFDRARFVVTVEAAAEGELALWAAGINTVGVASTYDTNGRVTNWTVYGFDNEGDAATYANEYALNNGLVSAPTQALVRAMFVETFAYSAEGRFRYSVRRAIV